MWEGETCVFYGNPQSLQNLLDLKAVKAHIETFEKCQLVVFGVWQRDLCGGPDEDRLRAAGGSGGGGGERRFGGNLKFTGLTQNLGQL